MHYHASQMNTRTDTTKGFSLIELMVSLSLFSIVMLVSVGTLIMIIDVNAKAQAIYSSTTNLSFALDSMTREIRTGYNYYCATTAVNNFPTLGTTGDCAGGTGQTIMFIREEDGEQIGYRISSGVIQQKEGSGSWMPITSSGLVVNVFDLTVTGSSPHTSSNNEDQPIIDMNIKGYVNNGLDTDTDFSVQTRVTQRRLDTI